MIKKSSRMTFFLMAIPLTLSTFTHLFNPIGFPCVHYDEGVYMRRAMHVLEGMGAQDPVNRFDHAQDSSSSYDHPYFGPIFLAGVLGAIGYPKSVTFSSPPLDALHTVMTLYLVPRILMGVLAIVDTLLIFKIAERRYNRTVAIIASILFAVMPLSWLTRRIYLDTILMPFLLSSILFALYRANNLSQKYNASIRVRTLVPVILSGILLGLAIFTKTPAFAMVAVVGFLIYTHNNKNWKVLGLWFIPVILIPLIWPAYSIWVGQFNEWLNGALWQGTQRQQSTLVSKEQHQILGSFSSILAMDPVLVAAGIAGVVFVSMKKDFLLLLWLISFLIFGYLIGWISYFHFVLVLPVFCIAVAVLIDAVSKRIRRNKAIQQKLLVFAITLTIGTFGLMSTIMLITNNFFLTQFGAAAFVAQNMQHISNYSFDNKATNENNTNSNNDVTIISSPIYTWLFTYNFGYSHVFHTRDTSDIKTKKVILIVDAEYRHVLSKIEVEDQNQIERLQKIYDRANTVATFGDTGVRYDFKMYPYTNIRECEISPTTEIQIKAN